MLRFQQKMSVSLQRDVVLLEELRMKMCHEPLLEAETEPILGALINVVQSSTKSDHRDFGIVPSYQPYGAPSWHDITTMGPKVTVGPNFLISPL